MTSPEPTILGELLARDPAFVSGAALARKLGMSRVGIWMHMEKLRAQGFEFEAVRGRGYRIRKHPAGINPLLVLALERAAHQQLRVLLDRANLPHHIGRQHGTDRHVDLALVEWRDQMSVVNAAISYRQRHPLVGQLVRKRYPASQVRVIGFCAIIHGNLATRHPWSDLNKVRPRLGRKS